MMINRGCPDVFPWWLPEVHGGDSYDVWFTEKQLHQLMVSMMLDLWLGLR